MSSNHKNLVFFNKEGDYLNFQYKDDVGRFEGDILFHENSSDTFKTQALYMLERIPAFEYELPGVLTLDKFQLFNEFGMHFYGAKYQNEQIETIEPVNNDSNFYSKWIYGSNFEVKFPIGTVVIFDSPLMEFNDTNKTYIVVATKKNAVMIVSTIDNATFETTYYSVYSNPSTYTNKTISGVNIVGIYNYVDNTLQNNLSNWSEPNFYDKYYVGKKLNIVNSSLNDGTVTIVNPDVTDIIHYEYELSSAPTYSNIIMEVITRTDLPIIYEGPITITTDNKVAFSGDAPAILKPGTEFKIVGSVLNTNYFNVSSVPTFLGNTQLTYYATQSQVLWNNKIYECVYGYTQSATSSITPDNLSYWIPATYVSVDQTTIAESLLNCQLYLTTDHFYFDFGWTFSKAVTLASMAEKYTEDLKLFNIDLYYKYNKIKADLVYPSRYAEVNFYYDTVAPTASIGDYRTVYERGVQVRETLIPELNYDYSSNYSYNVVFTDIDEFGIKVFVNKMLYQEEVDWVYSGIAPDMERTIDRTLRNWLTRHYARLVTLGIIPTLAYIGNYASIYYNSIILRTQYPNVPIDFSVEVGTTANFNIEHSTVLFTDMGGYLSFTINDKAYDQSTFYLDKISSISIVNGGSGYTPSSTQSVIISSPSLPGQQASAIATISASGSVSSISLTDSGYGYDASATAVLYGATISNATFSVSIGKSQYPNIPATLDAWVESHSDYLEELGIYATNFNNLLKFDIKDIHKRFEYSIKIGKSLLPGQVPYTIVNKIKGNFGGLITSNEVLLPTNTDSLEEAGFATGMVFSINNTIYPFNNQEYNIQFLDPDRLNLSYQGPFWGLTDSLCNSSAFVTIAFNIGFGQTGCPPSFGPTSSLGGPFDPLMFDSAMFSLSYNPNTYVINNYDLNSYPGSSNLIDIQYVQISDSIYGLGDDVVVIDAFLGQYVTTISLPGNTQSIDMEYNTVNNYLYCLTKNALYVVDPLLNSLVQTITLLYSDPFDLLINSSNGDIYVSYASSPVISIWSSSNTSISTLSVSGNSFKMAYDSFDNDIFAVIDDVVNGVIRIGGNTRIVETSYGIPTSGMTSSAYEIYYEPVNESIYVYGTSSLYKIDNGSPSAITSVPTQTFNNIIFNNLTGEINISDSSTSFTQLDLNTDAAAPSGVSNYGYIVLNQFDGDIYLSSLSLNNIIVIDAISGSVKYTAPMSAQTTKVIFNPERNSVWALQPSTNSLVEVVVTVNSSINLIPSTYSVVGENLYGTLSDEYSRKSNMWLKTREYLRRPRENFEGEKQVQYYWKWFSDNVPQFFMYDFSGDQLPITGSYAYTGVKPLDKVVLNKDPNRDVTKTGLAEYQQTIFDRIEMSLDYIDSSTDISTEVVPSELFIGFNASEEGAIRSILQLYKKEDINFDIITNATNNNVITFETITNKDGSTYGQISLNVLSDNNFVDDDTDDSFVGTRRGLKVGQQLAIFVKDNTNVKNQYISPNNGRLVKIREIYNRTLIVDFINPEYDKLDSEVTKLSDYPKVGQTTYLTTTFRVWDREIGRFTVYGQTEVEDIRYKIELSNIGKNIGSNETFIFKEYDINEGGIDWTYLNKKRKEMLMMKHLIYPYIGSYKSIINAINYFGYNDLELNEYYRNIDELSANYLKLFKVEIPDIFDNTVEGWTENDFIKHTMPNEKYEATNLFNLTYNITDKEGNNVLNYSLDEVIIKLQGLKYWLQRNIIPLTHKILDITGRAYTVGGTQIQHRVHDVNNIKIKQSMTPVSFNMSEAYLMPVNSGSTVYNCVLDFSTQTQSVTPDYYTIDIKTYKTYKEWAPFTTYDIGDKIIYYGRIYESQQDSNKVKNPRKYEATPEWSANIIYTPTNIVKYNRDVYVYSGIGLTGGTSSATYSSTPPLLDTTNWLKITEWKEMDFEPVQKIYEYRQIDNLLPFNFTIDSNIDPFVVIEITSDNGYGLTYRDKKNYEVRGLMDLRDPVRYIDPIGPFQPISEIP